jgi:hypothetical protein
MQGQAVVHPQHPANFKTFQQPLNPDITTQLRWANQVGAGEGQQKITALPCLLRSDKL